MNASKKPQLNIIGRVKHWQMVTFYLVIYDLVAVSAAYFLALLLRFDFHYSEIPAIYLQPWQHFAPIYAAACIAVFAILRLYRSIWRFASYTELNRIAIASLVTCAYHIVFITIFFQRMPISYYIIGAVLQFVLIVGVRFSYRFVLLVRSKNKGANAAKVMLVGAGSAGQMILRDMKRAGDVHEKVVCIIDDNPNKWNREIEGVDRKSVV